WYVGSAFGPLHRTVALVALGLVVGVLAACTASQWDDHDWLAYHVLTVSWGAVGLATLIAGWVRSKRPEGREREPVMVACVAAVGVLLVGLALRGVAEDVGRPYWPAGTVVFVSLLAAGLALWQCGEGWAFLAAAGVEVAAGVVTAFVYEGKPLAD